VLFTFSNTLGVAILRFGQTVRFVASNSTALAEVAEMAEVVEMAEASKPRQCPSNFDGCGDGNRLHLQSSELITPGGSMGIE
jgi:hypothetical protein